jgi:hypothetical protein
MNQTQEFSLLSTFRSLFEGKQYKHRDSSLGDLVANQLHEDLAKIGKSQKLVERMKTRERVVNLSNRAIGIVGINFARSYTSYEGAVPWPTDGKKHKHPVQEAAEAEKRLNARARPSFEEFQLLRFTATNVPPFPFEWLDYTETAKEYGALLIRVSREYDRRFS